ncbi:FkbM family methyltransferase [Xanthobacter sediminis]
MTVFAESSRFIMDLGMNNGDDTAYYLAKDFDVVALEPNPALATAARTRFSAAIAAKRLTLVEAAVGTERGVVTFCVNADGHWTRAAPDDAPPEAHPARAVDVPALTLGDLFDRFGTPLYLNIDVEGADRTVLHQLVGQLVKPLYVSIEDSRFGFDFITALGACGYNGFQFVDLSAVPGMVDPDLPFTFAPGSSGPFGDALPGPWLHAEPFEALYAATVRNRDGSRIAPPGRMFDIHATRL